MRTMIQVLGVSVSKDENGSLITTFYEKYTLKAAIKFLSGTKGITNDEIFTSRNILFTVYYRDIIETDRIYYNYQQYKINSIEEIGVKEGLLIECELIEGLSDSFTVYTGTTFTNYFGTSGTSGVNGSGFNWIGNWNVFYRYTIDDVVYYNGSSYINITGNNTTSPPNSDTLNWAIIASSGTSGTSGVGEAGTSGTSGESPDVSLCIMSHQTREIFVTNVEPITGNYGDMWFDIDGKKIKLFDGLSWVSFL